MDSFSLINNLTMFESIKSIKNSTLQKFVKYQDCFRAKKKPTKSNDFGGL